MVQSAVTIWKQGFRRRITTECLQETIGLCPIEYATRLVNKRFPNAGLRDTCNTRQFALRVAASLRNADGLTPNVGTMLSALAVEFPFAIFWLAETTQQLVGGNAKARSQVCNR